MGCCFSSDEDKNSQTGDVGERTRLLGNPVSNNQVRSSPHDDYGTHHGDPLQKKGDEQSALNRILHQTATNVIDVSALEAHNLEQHEYMIRARHYSERVTGAATGYYQSHKLQGILNDMPNPDKILGMDCVPLPDLFLIETFTDKATNALNEVKVVHQEDLVVQFGIP